MTQAKKKNKPFRQTKKLIRMALEDGWTQTEIAKKARVTQSVVSGWATGKTKAKENQIQFLLDEYGDRLRNGSCHVYCHAEKYYEVDQNLINYLKKMDIPLPDNSSHISSIELRTLIKAGIGEEVRLPAELVLEKREELFQVDAPIIFRFTFQCELIVHKKIRKVSTHRWLLHNMGRGGFILARQYRRTLSGEQSKTENRRRQQFSESGVKVPKIASFPDILIGGSNDEAGRWLTDLDELKTTDDLIARTEKLVEGMKEVINIRLHDLGVVLFLLKKALIEAGFPIKGVRKFAAF
ncbi:helix-turn-helix domain-containing protein [Endozoicomonas sp. ALB115]|uniref:helix-turn-helix domain-containing protein n=1 Tax=Endozoicomonas sp. ALB115 TaxID=3403074 RepID=UPI003BB5F262